MGEFMKELPTYHFKFLYSYRHLLKIHALVFLSVDQNIESYNIRRENNHLNE